MTKQMTEIEARLRNIALGRPQIVSAGDWNIGVRKVDESAPSGRQPYAGKLAAASSLEKKMAAAAANQKLAKVSELHAHTASFSGPYLSST